MNSPLYKIFICHFLNPISDHKCKYIANAGVVLKRYKINNKSKYKVIDVKEKNKILAIYKNKRSIEIIDKSSMIMLPGFFDMHFHWVQDDVRDKPKKHLLKWLKDYTWPYEAKFHDKLYSKDKAKLFSKELLRFGTVGGACYSSIHKHSVHHAHKFFIGEYIIGNVLMDMNSPKDLMQEPLSALKIVKELSVLYKNKYALTPRFAYSSSPNLMKKSSKIAKSNKSFIQTHLSENTFEIKSILEIYKKFPSFEKVKSYTEIYKKCNILGKKTLMGHGIHLDKEELKMLKDTETSIIHCPTSNAPVKDKGLGSGLFNFQMADKMKIKWALGSDIGAGPYLSMFDVIHSFVSQNKKLGHKKATYIKALYRSTLAGAKILNLEKKYGNLENGKYANFILVKSPPDINNKNAESVLSKLIAKGPKSRLQRTVLTQETYYQGISVYNKDSNTI